MTTVKTLAELLALPVVHVDTDYADWLPPDIELVWSRCNIDEPFADVPGVEVRYFTKWTYYAPSIKALYLDGEPVLVSWKQRKAESQYWLISVEREYELWARVRQAMHARGLPREEETPLDAILEHPVPLD